MLFTSCHKYLKIIGIELTHMLNRRLRLVEGAPVVDDHSSTLWIKGNHARRGMDPLLQLNIRAQHHPIRQPIPARLNVCRPMREHRSSGYPDRASSPISSMFEGHPTRIPSSRGALASLGAPSKTSWSLGARSGEFTKIIALSLWDSSSRGGLTLRAHIPLTHPCGKPDDKARNFLLLNELTGNYACPVHEVFQPGADYLHLSSPRPIFFLLLCQLGNRPWTLRLGGSIKPH